MQGGEGRIAMFIFYYNFWKILYENLLYIKITI